MVFSVSQIDADDEVVMMLHKHVVVDYQEQKVLLSHKEKGFLLIYYVQINLCG